MVTIFGSLLNTLGIRRVDLGREEVTEAGPMVEREFLVPNMVCEGCAEKIEGALSSLPGVRDVRSKVPQKRIRVRYDPATVREDQLRDAVSNIGFTALDA